MDNIIVSKNSFNDNLNFRVNSLSMLSQHVPLVSLKPELIRF